jgi:hypothetical protein
VVLVCGSTKIVVLSIVGCAADALPYPAIVKKSVIMIAEFINVIILFFIFPPVFIRAKQFSCGTRVVPETLRNSLRR